MISNATPFMLNHLRQALRMNADELRFVSGRQPSLKVGGELRPAGGVVVRAEIVQALHEACLVAAERGDLQQASHASYAVTFPGVGTFSCEFRTMGSTNSFSLYREPEAHSLVEQSRKSRPPSSGAEAVPYSPSEEQDRNAPLPSRERAA